MTDRAKALRALIEGVEAGEWVAGWRQLNAAGVAHGSFGQIEAGCAWDAFHGSLDAAKALHQAVLPGRRVEIIGTTSEGDWLVNVLGADSQFSTIPARAWLLSILRALEAQEAGT
jgi:hypothetical protein